MNIFKDGWLMQAQQAHEQAIQARNKLATNCSEGRSYLEQLQTEHQQSVGQNEARFQAAAKATQEVRATAADDASKVIELGCQRDELTSSLAIAQAKVKTLTNKMAAVKKQSDFDREFQEQTINDLRQDNSKLKEEMDELRQMVQALSNANKTAAREPPPASPAKPGLSHPEPPAPEEKPGTSPVGEPRSQASAIQDFHQCFLEQGQLQQRNHQRQQTKKV